MNIRPLTADEIAKSKIAKDTANKIIRAHRKELSKQIKQIQKCNPVSFTLKFLIKEYEALRTIKGTPVIVALTDDTICVNYEILRKLAKSLNRQWYCETKIENSMLTTTYQKGYRKGVFSLNELPTYQTKLLSELPIIEIGS